MTSISKLTINLAFDLQDVENNDMFVDTFHRITVQLGGNFGYTHCLFLFYQNLWSA